MRSNDDSIASQLKAEAEQFNEPFSPALHARVMQGLHQPLPAQQGRSIWRQVGIAAVFVIGLTAGWMSSRMRSPQPIVQNVPAPAPTPSQRDLSVVADLLQSASSPFGEDLRRTIPHSPMAGLDQDAQAFGRFVARQFDQLPTRTEVTR